jgi:hypothetical protein
VLGNPVVASFLEILLQRHVGDQVSLIARPVGPCRLIERGVGSQLYVSARAVEVETGMHSEPTTGVISEAKRASESPVAQFLARAGLTARGVIYILIGWVAVLVALGQSSQEADQRGALELLAGKPYGLVSL